MPNVRPEEANSLHRPPQSDLNLRFAACMLRSVSGSHRHHPHRSHVSPHVQQQSGSVFFFLPYS